MTSGFLLLENGFCRWLDDILEGIEITGKIRWIELNVQKFNFAHLSLGVDLKGCPSLLRSSNPSRLSNQQAYQGVKNKARICVLAFY